MNAWVSAVIKNFYVPENASGIIRVQCKHCETFISGTSTSAGNFLKHLKRKHMDTFQSLTSLKYKLENSKHSKIHTSKGSKSLQEDSALAESSPKKYMNYSKEFKVKVLQYYFKNGGEQCFGLKSKTAQMFRIDKKTINRMLSNPDMVTIAYKGINQKPPSALVESKQCGENQLSESDSPRLSSAQNTVVIDLPEDPDFSILKKAISSTTNGIGNLTRLLLTGTKEIQKIILEECDVIYECKVCRNLFRSLVNLLAHKRIYCQEQFANVQNIFNKDNCDGKTTDSNTVIVEPEPPDEFDQIDGTGTKIDQIAAKLALKNNKSSRRINKLSSSENKGSSGYYDRIQRTQESRNNLTKDSSVILRNISGFNKAVYQDYVPHGRQQSGEGTKELARQVMENRMGVTAMLDEDGKIIGTQPGTPTEIDLNRLKEVKNSNSYSNPSPIDSPCHSPSVEENEPEECDSYERTIYTCPICSTLFLSMGGCNKHLLKVHKKKKHQRDRLRQVIASRTYKKKFTKEALKNYHKGNDDKMVDNPSVIHNLAVSKIRKLSGDKIRSEDDVSQHREVNRGRSRDMWRCNVCQKTFCSGPIAQTHVTSHRNCNFKPRAIPFLKSDPAYSLLKMEHGSKEEPAVKDSETLNQRKRKLSAVIGSRKRKLYQITPIRPYDDIEKKARCSIERQNDYIECSVELNSIQKELDEIGIHKVKLETNNEHTDATHIEEMKNSNSEHLSIKPENCAELIDIKMEPILDCTESRHNYIPTRDNVSLRENTLSIKNEHAVSICEDFDITNPSLKSATSCPLLSHIPSIPCLSSQNIFPTKPSSSNPIVSGANVNFSNNYETSLDERSVCPSTEETFFQYKVEFENDPVHEAHLTNKSPNLDSNHKKVGKIKFTKLAAIHKNQDNPLSHASSNHQEKIKTVTDVVDNSVRTPEKVCNPIKPSTNADGFPTLNVNSIILTTNDMTVGQEASNKSLNNTSYTSPTDNSSILSPNEMLNSSTHTSNKNISNESSSAIPCSSSEKSVKTFQKQSIAVSKSLQSHNVTLGAIGKGKESSDICLDDAPSAETTIDVNLSIPAPSFGYLGFQAIMDYPLAFPRPDESKVGEETTESSITEIKYSWDL